MVEYPLALAINGRESLLARRLVAWDESAHPNGDSRAGPVVILGLGYVGLPTAYALRSRHSRSIGVDISEDRLQAIKAGEADLPEADREGLAAAIADGSIELSSDTSVLSDVDAVIICVPTPVDEHRVPDLAPLRSACATAVAQARVGQTIILTSTTFVGTTRQLLVEPLAQRGFVVGTDVHVAFSPERIDPGNTEHVQRETPRVLGGATAECSERAARVIGHLTDSVYLVNSPESAELTKLYENIFRAVNLALANEIADVCGGLGLDPVEVTIAAGTKPYGFLGSFPGPGVGGHCIPCDPHYLLWQLRGEQRSAPLIEQAMRAIDDRPGRVVQRVTQLLTEATVDPSGARVLLVGASYKAGVRDLRESPSLPIMSGLAWLGVDVRYHDPLLPEVVVPEGPTLRSEPDPGAQNWDLVVIHTVHPGFDYSWVGKCGAVLDATYLFDAAPNREVV